MGKIFTKRPKPHADALARENHSDSAAHSHDLPDHNHHSLHLDEAVTSIAGLADGQCAIGTVDGSLFIYCTETGKITQKWEGHGKTITQVRWDPVYQVALSSCRDLSACIWEKGSTQSVKRLEDYHSLVVSSVASNEGQQWHVCTGSRDNCVALWDAATCKVIRSEEIAQNMVTDLCWKDGKLAQTSEDKSLRLWDPIRLQVATMFPRKQQILLSCDIKGDLIATSSSGFTGTGCEVTLWDARFASKSLFEFRGHHEKVHRCIFIHDPNSSGSDILASIGADRTVRLWDTKCMQPIATLTLAQQLTTIAQVPMEGPNVHFCVGTFDSGIKIVTYNPVLQSLCL